MQIMTNFKITIIFFAINFFVQVPLLAQYQPKKLGNVGRMKIQHRPLTHKQLHINRHKMSGYQGEMRIKFGADKKYYSIDGGFSVLNYYGDLSPRTTKLSTDISLTKPGYTFGVTRRIGPRYSLFSKFTCSRIVGSDHESANADDKNAIYRYNRNLSFRNKIRELSFGIEVDAFENKNHVSDRAKWTPYITAGVAVFHHNPQAVAPSTDLQGNPLPHAGEWVDLQPLGTEGQNQQLKEGAVNYGNKPYKLIQPALIFGVGFRMRISDSFDCSIHYGFRYLFTDYIDDVSKNYVDLGGFGTNELAKAMSYRSNEVANPTYTYTSAQDGKTYKVIPGYGSENPQNMRGQYQNKDKYTVLSIQLSYMVSPYVHMRRAKSQR
jgi:hypothetical protein